MNEGEQGGGRQEEWKSHLRRVPGLVCAYRWLRDGWWRMRAALPLGSGAKRRIASVWGGDAVGRDSPTRRAPREWLDSKEVLWGYVFPQFGGLDWYHYVAQRYCPQPRGMGLSLCCGDGHVERDFLRYGVCEAAEGVDASPDAIEVCQREAEAAGLSERLSYRVQDVERGRLRPSSYDVVVAWMALHHLRRLTHVFREVRRALRPGGVFIVNEYVGPARFQVPTRRVAVINEILQELPEELRRLRGGGIKERFDPPKLPEIIRHDPSEAVCSHRILPLLRRNFVLAECVEYGGTVLNWLLSGIVQNFRSDDAEHRKWLDRLYAAEREVLESGKFGTDFAFVIAERSEDRVAE